LRPLTGCHAGYFVGNIKIYLMFCREAAAGVDQERGHGPLFLWSLFEMASLFRA
jgi:hypothetical protein